MDIKEVFKKQVASDKGKTLRSISFDLQAILSVPHTGFNQIYYKHKLNDLNMTIYDGSTANGFCGVWG